MRDLLPARKAEPGPLLGASQCSSPSAAPHKVRTAGERNTLLSDRAPWAPICPLSEAFLPCSPWYLFADLSDRCSHCSESHPPTPRGGGGGGGGATVTLCPAHCQLGTPARAVPSLQGRRERQPRLPPCFRPSSLCGTCCCCSQHLEHQLSTCSSPAPGSFSSLRQRFLKCTVCRDLPSSPPALSPALCHLFYLSHLCHLVAKPWAASAFLQR